MSRASGFVAGQAGLHAEALARALFTTSSAAIKLAIGAGYRRSRRLRPPSSRVDPHAMRRTSPAGSRQRHEESSHSGGFLPATF